MNKRVTFYIDEKLYLQLRSQLVLKQITVSDWLRTRIKRFLERAEKEQNG